MRTMFRATTIALVLSVTAGMASAQTPAGSFKVAFVNTQALMDAAPGRAAAEALLSKEGDSFRDQLQKKQDSLNAMVAKYQKEEPTLSATQKDTRQKQLQTYSTDFQNAQQQFQQQFQARENEVMGPITDAVKKVIDDIRVEDGYAVIFSNDGQASPVISADKNLDITDRVVSRLRATKAPALPSASAMPAPAANTPAKPGTPGSPAGVTRSPIRQ